MFCTEVRLLWDSFYTGVYSTITPISKLFQPATCNLQNIPAGNGDYRPGLKCKLRFTPTGGLRTFAPKNFPHTGFFKL